MHSAARVGASAPIHVATVDHRLRPGSAEEAATVAAEAGRLGMPHHLLVRDGAPFESGIQSAARDARYALLASCAREIGAGLVLTGHTRDDQAETVLMRLMAGSGPGGLAGMRRERALAPGIRLGRPFLDLAKADLVAWCEARGIAYLSDPSNANPRFARARLRGLLPRLARDGLTPARLARLAERAARDEDALTATARTAFETALRAEAPPLHLDGQAVAGLPDAVALRVLALAMESAGAAGPDRLERLERLAFEALLPALREGRAVRRTLRGLVVEATRAGEIVLTPAPPRRALTSDAAGAPELLGKGAAPTYIGAERRLERPSTGRAPVLPKD